MRILFCTDGSRISFNALNNFAKWSKGAIVDVICVIDWSFLPDEVSIQEDGFATSCANIKILFASLDKYTSVAG